MAQLRYEVNSNRFLQITGCPISYWMNNKTFKVFSGPELGTFAFSCKGLDTCDNDTYVRTWQEVEFQKIGLNINSVSQTYKNNWFPYCKGGGYRKWYGNLEKVVLWKDDGRVLRNLRDENGKIKSRPQNTKYYFAEGLTFNSISSSYRAVRYMNNSIFGGGGSGLFANNKDLLYALSGLINSNVSYSLFQYINPGFNFLVGDLLRIPIIQSDDNKKDIINLAKNNIGLAKSDWDSFEESWDFKRHPLV